jgi:2-polyprenyl-6-methoxyphenol hydroxylase-like FAD-dependent oxidoreductase
VYKRIGPAPSRAATPEAQPEIAPVLIVGGSLVGLSAAMFLAARGVPCVVVERHLGSSPHPRAIGYTQRTLEMFDTAGLRGVPEVPPSFRLRRVRTESLAGRWLEETDFTPQKSGTEAPRENAAPPSPHQGAAIAQDRLEPMLREQARKLGATLSLGTELVRFEQDAEGVDAWLRDRDGTERRLRASYLIACDGNRSAVREALGIERQGIGVIQVMRSVLFRADLEKFQRGASQFEIEQPDLDAFLTTYGDGRWVLMFKDDVERDDATLKQAIARAIGAPEAFEIITTGRWELTALIADRFCEGRVFLAGDAAHTLPPTRGGSIRSRSSWVSCIARAASWAAPLTFRSQRIRMCGAESREPAHLTGKLPKAAPAVRRSTSSDTAGFSSRAIRLGAQRGRR